MLTQNTRLFTSDLQTFYAGYKIWKNQAGVLIADFLFNLAVHSTSPL